MAFENPDLSGQTAFITGTTRGVGKAFALSLAECGCNIVSTGKTSESDDYGEEKDLEGSIEQTAREVRERGAEAISIQLNVREAEEVEAAVERTVNEFGGIDVCINNAGAIQMATVEEMSADRFDLMTDVNVRGAYVTARQVLPHLKESGGHILFNSPPNVLQSAPGKAAYSWSKQGMTFVAKSLAEEVSGYSVGVNAVWPVTALDTRATRYFGMGTEDDWRSPEILADAVLELISRDPDDCTGNAFYDEELLREAGVTDFSPYNLTEGEPAPLSAQIFDPTFERPA
jgi:citronellol/citronellal dehydrogenase